MLDRPESDEFPTRIAYVEAHRVPLREIGCWFAPWVLAGILALIFLAGLWCASVATDNGTFAIGLSGAALALIALVWELGAALGSGRGDLAPRWLVEDDASLVVLIALLAVLGLGGIVLAARSSSAAVSGAGYGLFTLAIVVTAISLKHYFDHREG